MTPVVTLESRASTRHPTDTPAMVPECPAVIPAWQEMSQVQSLHNAKDLGLSVNVLH